MTMIGTLVHGALATVSPKGLITPWTPESSFGGGTAGRFGSAASPARVFDIGGRSDSGTGELRWWVAAEDRWHDPEVEVTVRQRLLEGVPVVETSLRVPTGDVVHRAFAVAYDTDGLIVVDVENQSKLAVAVAFNRSDLWTNRPPANVPIEGIVLPPGSIVVPIAKGSTVRVAFGRGAGQLPEGLPSSEEVARGWLQILDRSPRVMLPDASIRESLLADRAAVLLGPLPVWPVDPTEYLLIAGEKGLGGRPTDELVDDVVQAAIKVAKGARKHSTPSARWALHAAQQVLQRAAQPLAVADIARMITALGPETQRPAPRPPASLGGDRPKPEPQDAAGEVATGRRLASTMHGLATLVGDAVCLLDRPVPSDWFGQPIEVHDAPIGTGTASFAILWDTTHEGPIRCPGLDPTWQAQGRRGDALLAAPLR
jgi:hypothetical protein